MSVIQVSYDYSCLFPCAADWCVGRVGLAGHVEMGKMSGESSGAVVRVFARGELRAWGGNNLKPTALGPTA